MRRISAFLAFSSVFIFSCTYEKKELPVVTAPENTGYPAEIAQIILNRCNNPGCHNSQSFEGADGLNMSNWEALFKGTETGPAVIPYNPEQSPLFLFTNSYPDMGVRLSPRMPLNSDSLSRKEMQTLRTWILQGAPRNDGYVIFSDQPDRPKLYVCNQGCDLLEVVDLQSGILMRAPQMGNDPVQTESPHMIKVSPDGQNLYSVFFSAGIIERFNTQSDNKAGFISIGDGNWNTMCISPDSKHGYAVNTSAGKLSYIDLQNMKLVITDVGYNNPHGIAASPDFKTLYLTSQFGNYIYKIDITDPEAPDRKTLSLEKGVPITNTSKLDPHDIMFSPDGSKYFITCQKSNELRVFNTANDSLLATLPTGFFPQEMAVSTSQPYIFDTCPDDSLGAVPQFTRGSVYVYNYNTLSLAGVVYGFYQPHGIGVDDKRGLVYIASRNKTKGGPAPHHSTACGGTNGFLSRFSLNTLQKDGYKVELSVDPYSIAIRK